MIPWEQTRRRSLHRANLENGSNMDRYLLIELSSEGLAFETAQADLYLSWLGLGLILAGLVAFKLFKRFKGAK